VTRLLYQLGSLLTRALNVFPLLGEASMTTSARAYDKGTDCPRWRRFERFIDFLFSPYESGHCARVWNDRVERAHETARRDIEIRNKRGVE
jgi:hypothetical protein